MAVAQVAAVFTANIGDIQSKMTVVQRSFDAVGDAATFSSEKIRQVGTAMADAGTKMTIGLTLPLGGVAIAATNAAMSFETSMNKIVGLVGIASNEVASMGEEVRNMAGLVGKTPDELANGLYVVTSAGLRGAEAMQALKASSMAGAAGLGETNDIARAVSGALAAYGSDVLSAADATDAIVATARAGNFETSQFAAAIGRVLPFAQQAGASFQEMGGAVALLTRVNGDAAQSVTQIQALFRAFVVPTEEAKTSLAEFGLTAQDVRDSISQKGLAATLQMLDNALGGNREQLGRLLGSSEAASAAFQILGADAATLQETFGVVNKSAGMTREAFDAVAQTAQFQVNQAMAELKATLIDLGNQFLPIVSSIMNFMQTHLRAFSSLPGPVKTTITVIGALVAAIGPLLFIAGKLIIVFAGLLSIMMKARAVGMMRAAFAGLRGELAVARASMAQTQSSIGRMGIAAQMARVTISTSFRAIGAAAKSLLASLGPVGIAFLALGVAFEVVINKSAEAEAKALEYADALDSVTGAATRASEELILTKLMTEELGGVWSTVGKGLLGMESIPFKELADRAQISFFAISKGLQGTKDDYDSLVASIMEAVRANRLGEAEGKLLIQTLGAERQAIEDVRREREIEAQAALEARDAYLKSAAAHTQYRDAAVRSHEANQAVADSFDTAGFSAEQAAEEIAFMRAELELWTGTASAIAAVDRAAESMEDIGEAAVKFGTNLMGQTPKAREFRAAVLQAYNDSADAAGSMSDKVSEQRAAFTSELIKMVASLRASGVKDSDIRAFLGAMDDLPASVSDIMRATGVAIGDADFKDPIEKAFKKSVKSGTPMTADAMAEMARGASDAAREELGLTLEPELTSIIKSATTALRPTAFNNGELTGKSIGSGTATGILRSSPVVEAAIRRVIQKAHAAAKAEAESTSPSELFARTGDDLVAGLALGVRRSTASGVQQISKAARLFMRAFMESFAPREMGAAESAIVEAIEQAESMLAYARDRLKTANKEVKEAEKALSDARKGNDAKEIAKAERDLAKAREEAASATDAAKLGEWVRSNEDALKALQKIAAQYDYIVAKMDGVKEAFSSISELLATPLGTASNLSQMFGLDVDPRSMANNYMDLADQIRNAYAVLTDPKIVGRSAARANRNLMNQTIGELEGYVTQIMALQEEYEANVQAIADNEAKWREDERRLSAALAEATKNYDEVISQQEKIRDGFRSFVNDIGRLTDGMVAAVKTQTRELANGVRLIVQSADTTSAAGAIAANMKARLDEVKAFSANVKTLMERGLDPSLVRDFVEAGVSRAGQIVADLASATDDELKQINETQAELLAHSGKFAEAYLPSGDLKAAVDAAKKELEDTRTAYEAERDRLNAEQKRIEGDIAVLVTQIEALVTGMMTTLVPATEAAAQASIDAMIAQFKKDFPRLQSEFGNLMDRLAKSMERSVTITVRTVQGGGTGATSRSVASGFTPSPVRLATATSARSVTVAPNAVSVNVNAGAGMDRAAIVSQVKAAVDESLESLAREIVAA